MKKLFVLLCTLSSIAAFSQVAADIEYNNVRARVNNDGIWFRNNNIGDNSNWEAAFEVPKDEGASSIYTTAFWMGGLSTDQSLKLAALRFGEDTEYSIGPKSSNSASQEFLDKYNHIWHISRQEILHHQVNYASPNYEMPWSIATWPGNGDVNHGEASLLAPFIDLNSDGVYSPSQGDYPDIRGDDALYFMLNDYNHPHDESGGSPIGVNIRAMTYAYTDVEGSPLNNCVFVSLKIRNDGTQSLSDFYVGVYNDFDLGNAIDDYIASDSLRNMTYVYNGDNLDETQSGQIGYGSYLPSQGCMFLNHQMAKAVYYNNATGVNGDPVIAMDFYNYMRGIWRDNTPLTEGGFGYGGTTQANYMFSGDPVTNTGWTEMSANNQPYDRRMLMSTGPFDFLPGEQLCIDVAFPFARSAQQNNRLDAVVELRQAADFIQNFYDSQNHDCALQIVGVEENDANLSKVSVYPNPSNGRFTISSNDEIKYVEVYDSLGKRVLTKNATRNNSRSIEVDLSKESKGVYLYQVYDALGNMQSCKVIVE